MATGATNAIGTQWEGRVAVKYGEPAAGSMTTRRVRITTSLWQPVDMFELSSPVPSAGVYNLNRLADKEQFARDPGGRAGTRVASAGPR